MFSWLAHALGLYEGMIYHAYSGIIPCLAVVSIVTGWWKKHTCHEAKCWRFGKHPVGGTPYKTCHKHHPGIPGNKVSSGDIQAAYDAVQED